MSILNNSLKDILWFELCLEYLTYLWVQDVEGKKLLKSEKIYLSLTWEEFIIVTRNTPKVKRIVENYRKERNELNKNQIQK